MIIKKSELQILEFNMLGINIISFPDNADIDDHTSDEFDIEFEVFISTENDRHFKIMIRLNNFKNDQPLQGGYGIDVTGEFKYKFKKNIEISDDRKSQLVSRSAIPMAIAHFRSIIALTTSNFYKGSYFLPSIDLNHLFQKKLESIEIRDESEV